MRDPIYPIRRGDDGVREIPRVERQRLLTPAEREEARRKREEARKQRTPDRPVKEPAQERRSGVDYTA